MKSRIKNTLKLRALKQTLIFRIEYLKPQRLKISVFIALIFIVFYSACSLAKTGLLTGSFGGGKLYNNDNNIVYTEEGSSEFQFNLFMKPVRGGSKLKLSESLGPNGSAESFQISRNEARVVYLGKTSAFGISELYSVPINGGPSVKLNVSFGAPRYIVSFKISPNSAFVLYELLESDQLSKQLYKVPIGGGASLPLGVASQNINLGHITPDSSYMIFAGGNNPFELDQYSNNLFRVNLTTGVFDQLNDDIAMGGHVDFPVFSSDGQTVVYDAVTTQPAFSIDVLSVQVIGGAPVKLNPPIVPGGAISHKFIGPLGQFVYYVADQVVVNQNRLFKVPIGGGLSTELITNFSAGESISGLLSTRVNAVGSHAVFEVDGIHPIRHLYSVSLQTGQAVKLNSGGRVLRFKISDDGNFVIFNNDAETMGIFELFSIPIGGGAPVKLNSDYQSLANTGSGINYDISRDSKRVVYWMDIEGDFQNEILEVPIGGGLSEKLSPNLPPGADVGFPVYSDDGTLALFTISEFEGVFHGLYAFDFKKVDSEFCFPVITNSSKAAVICL